MAVAKRSQVFKYAFRIPHDSSKSEILFSAIRAYSSMSRARRDGPEAPGDVRSLPEGPDLEPLKNGPLVRRQPTKSIPKLWKQPCSWALNWGNTRPGTFTLKAWGPGAEKREAVPLKKGEGS